MVPALATLAARSLTRPPLAPLALALALIWPALLMVPPALIATEPPAPLADTAPTLPWLTMLPPALSITWPPREVIPVAWITPPWLPASA